MKRFFDFKLYVDGLKKTGLLAFLIGAASVILTMLPCVFNANASIYSVYLPFAFCIILAPVLIMRVFSFLFRKDLSEEMLTRYPSKTSLLISLFSSCLTWIWCIIILCFGLSYLAYSVFTPSDDIIELLFCLLPAILSSSVKLIGLAAIALFITGKRLSCIAAFLSITASLTVLSAVILFSPLHLFPSFVGFDGPFAILSPVFLSPFSGFSLLPGERIFFGAWEIFYSIASAVSILLVARQLLSLRTAEYAESDVTRKSYRAFLRLCASFPFALYGVYNLLIYFFSAFENEYMNIEKLISFLLFLLLSLIAWCLADALFTRNIKGCLKSLAGIPLLAFAVSCYATGMLVMQGAVLSFMPEMENVAAIQNVFNSNPYAEGTLLEFPLYIEEICVDVRDTSELIKAHGVTEDDNFVAVKIHLKNGNTVIRNIIAPHPLYS